MATISYIGVLYFISLVLIIGYGVRQLCCDGIDKVLIGFIVLWVDWIVTGHIASLFRRLNDPWLYSIISFIIAAGMAWGLRSVSVNLRLRVASNPLLAYEPRHLLIRRLLYGGLLGTFIVFAVLDLLMALRIPPHNPDSMMYRLTRVYWYVSNGSLYHFAPSADADPRALFYPLNGVLIQIPVVLFQFPSHVFTLISWSVWCLAAVGIFRICGYFGASRFVSLFTAWIVLVSPVTFVLAISTNDELLASLPILLGIGFFTRYIQTRLWFFLVLTALASGCGLGTKIHFYYYWPLLPIALFIVIQEIRKNQAWRCRWQWVMCTSAVVLTVMLSAPFIYYNYASSRIVFHPMLVKLAANQPFSFAVGVHTFLLQTMSMLVSPFADLFVHSSRSARRHFIEAFRENVSGWIQPFVRDAPEYYLDRFRNLVHDLAYVPHENSVWQGFLPLFLVMTWILVWHHRRAIHPLLQLYTYSLPAWWLIFCFSTRYFETAGIHTVYPAIVASPTLAFFWLPIQNRFWRFTRRLIVGIVVGTHLVFAYGLLMYGMRRNVQEMFSSEKWNLDTFRASPQLREAFQSVRNIDLAMVHYGAQYLPLMDLNPAARYTVRSYPVAPKLMYKRDLIVYPIPATSMWGWIPVAVRKEKPGLLYLGSIWSNFGGHNIFGTSRNIKKSESDLKQYIVLKSNLSIDSNGMASITIEESVLGAKSEDRLEYRYSIRKTGVVLCKSNWEPTAVQKLTFWPGDKKGIRLFVEVRSPAEPQEVEVVRYRLFNSQPFDPERDQTSLTSKHSLQR